MARETRGCLCTGRRLTVLFLLMLALAALSLLLGSTTLSLPELIRAVRTGDRESVAWRIFFYTRLPRVLGGLLCGSGLAVAGAVLQVVLNNALAGPNIIGVNAGAGFGALLVMALFPRWAAALPVAAFLGALACAAVIYGVARLTGASRMTIVLAGVAISSVINAGAACLKILFPDILAAYNSFSVGTLNGVTLGEAAMAAPYWGAGMALILLLRGEMNLLVLGEELAQSLGLGVERCRMLLLLGAAVLAGASVSLCGLVGFVGLLVPHAVRALLGTDNRVVTVACIPVGASFVLLCDLLGRTVFRPFEIPAGILLSLVGGAYFVALLLRGRGGGKLHA